jgi:predicted esterase
MVLPDRSTAQTSVQQQPVPGKALGRLDDARLAALRNRIRNHALGLKPQDIANLAQGKPQQLPKQEPAAKPAATVSRPQAPAQLKQGLDAKQPAATDANQKTAPAPAPSQTASLKAADKPSRPSFNPYPHGPEPHAPALQRGYHPNVRVLAPGRLDWTFVVSSSSLDPAPSAATAGYVATQQSYELYVPPGINPRQPHALILHVPAGNRSDGWMHWQSVCQRHGVMLAGVHNAGNSVPMEARARVVLDVLDDVRRRFSIDPDRTYITGHSGGGHAASCIAYALPELFGGHIPICGTWNLRVQPMLRQRVSERLSVAVLTGATDFNRPELEREFYPILREQGVRAQLWVYPGMGHAYPNSGQLDQVFKWVEAGLPQRRMMSALFPASRMAHAHTPDEWSTAVLLEAGKRLEMPGGEASGLFMLQAVVDRWSGLPAASMAQKLLDEFDTSSPVSWKEIYKTERMKFRYLQARMFDGIVNSPPPPDYPVPRINLLQIAVALWQEIHDLAPANSAIAREASARLAELHREGA